MIGGDRANANPLDGDGNDSIYIGDAEVFSGNTIYGGGGNDTVTFSGDTSISRLYPLTVALMTLLPCTKTPLLVLVLVATWLTS